jgi:hypothetical protein
MLFAMNRGREVTMASRIGGMIFLLLCALGILLAGVINELVFLVVIGGIWTMMFAVVLAILIICNIRKNTARW